MQTKINTIQNGLMSLEEAREYLGISQRKMDELTRKRQIKFVRLGQRKFRKEWLDEYVERNATDIQVF